MPDCTFRVIHTDKKTKARVGSIETLHGTIHTPAFVPVGTQATVKSLTPEDLNTLGVQIFFVNTYHTYLRPGMQVLKKFGGLHQFMHWNKPIITDSGGFQVFSLGRHDLVKISDDGVEFRSHWDGSKHVFTPEKSMEYQSILHSDIHIAFDDCTPFPVTHTQARKSMDRTHQWAKRSLVSHTQGALYGVIQGSVFEDLRKESAKTICAMDFDGIAIGGVSVGESKREMEDVLRWVSPFLPDNKPRHLLGVGEIDDIFTLISYGMDTFDCVQPTRLARMGRMYTINGDIDITKKAYQKDCAPIDTQCSCYTCSHYSRAYMHHLFHVHELLGYRLATIHNLHFVQTLVSEIRASIENGSFLELKNQRLYNIHKEE